MKSTLILVGLFALVCAPVQIAAIDRSLCDTVPSGIDFGEVATDGCLELSGIPMQFIYHDVSGTNECGGSTTFARDLTRPINGDRCINFSNEECTYLYDGVVLDNYLTDDCQNDDGLFLPSGMKVANMLFKDSVLANTWKCAGGSSGWDGPNGTDCDPNEDDGGHIDGLQFRGLPMANGWIAFQDTDFVNGHHLHLLMETDNATGEGNFLFQGGHFGRLADAGAATNYPQDCFDRGTASSEICNEGKTQIHRSFDQVWIVDVESTATFSFKGSATADVVVIGDCPGDLDLVEGAGVATEVCYATLDAAEADGKTLPPFVELSDSGWLDSDSDGVPDFRDNCTLVANPQQCDDGNTPGVGNTCDMDYNQDGTVSGADTTGFGADFGSPGPGDGNCDGTVSGADSDYFSARFGLTPGPSCCGP